MDEKKQKALDFLRSQTDSSLLDKSSYSSPLSQDTMRVKGTPLTPEPVTRIANTTDKLNTKQVMGLGNAADVAKANAEKISRMKMLRTIGGKVPMLGAVTAGIGTMLGSDEASASDGLRAAAEELPGDLPVVGAAFDAIKSEDTGPMSGSFEDRLEKGLLSPQELEMLKQQYNQKK